MPRSMTEEEKKHLSKKRKEYLRENPDKHPWRKRDKFKSVPCGILKDLLKNCGISFVEEWIPLKDRSFSIDVAFPDIKLGLEVNGNQHYNADGTLKEYYQVRHDLIEAAGWKLIELHYSFCFNLTEEKILPLLKLKEQPDYSMYFEEKQKKSSPVFCSCGKEIWKYSKQCRSCSTQGRNRKVHNRPSREELKRLVEENGYCAVGRMFGVSDNSIRKWLK